MRRFAAAAVLVAFGATVAFAGPIEDRQAIMKGVAAATKTATGIAKGETPFDAAKAKEIAAVYENAAAKMPTLFPDDSKTGNDTTAAPKIWEDKAGFAAEFAKLGTDAKALAATTDTASFAAAFKTLTGECGTCHGTYRIKKG
ncbi:c-type cytochrome [Labrys wisconsinensis]|uniref:Cytochrome c556 n=1 Tax=Labrys wisconsinensis TaxID=425677 RepID=A0ABU0JE66_9HYPH|nr:cytochrome c [Labrys wisconsinensis]MDQ0472572.1 cytochrome c556 [Labrys wisconsinensis]